MSDQITQAYHIPQPLLEQCPEPQPQHRTVAPTRTDLRIERLADEPCRPSDMTLWDRRILSESTVDPVLLASLVDDPDIWVRTELGHNPTPRRRC